MRQLRLLGFAVTFVIIAGIFTSCGEPSSTPTPTPIPSPVPESTPTAMPSAQEIVNGAIESFDNIRTYQIDMDMTIDMTFKDEDDLSIANLVQSWSGILDVQNRQIELNLDVSVARNEQPKMTLGAEVYFINDILYILQKVPLQEPMWMKREAPEEWWEESQRMGWGESQIELL